MAFTASHYLEVARIIRTERECGRQMCARSQAGVELSATRIAGALSAMFSRQNPKFDAARFARDCTPEASP